MPSTKPKPSFTSVNFASGETRASKAGSSRTTADFDWAWTASCAAPAARAQTSAAATIAFTTTSLSRFLFRQRLLLVRRIGIELRPGLVGRQLPALDEE